MRPARPPKVYRTTWLYAFVLIAVTIFCSKTAPAESASNAKASKTVYLTENAHLKLSSEKGATITEHGEATGTYHAPIAATFTIRPKSVIAHVTIYPAGGSITGSADATYKIVGNRGYFGGTFTLGHCTGRYVHVAEVNHKALGISGIINRYNFQTEVKANGEATGF